ncbi:unnamed protein product [Hymenolepis diminuta]|uniref:G-patch domain-containing protein n=1 Tax=Hymenolepis diminuta TaxID=6216 RepID=A0A0R3SUC0_HYMDI|nr:unnamed protein product [Hymenolepis diminuta]VUZ43069.1 unnamed protein product [Hymenolepis diminuta]
MAGFPSNFAQRQLEKFGWSKGSGLGKNNNGISEPIKVKRKFSRLGLGAAYDHSKNDDYFFENLYNRAVSGYKDVASDKCVDSSTITYDSSKLKRQQKVTFQLHTVLNGIGEITTEQKETNSRKRRVNFTANIESSGSSTGDGERVPSKKYLKCKKKSRDPLPHAFSDTNLLDFGELTRKPTLGSGKLARAAEFI